MSNAQRTTFVPTMQPELKPLSLNLVDTNLFFQRAATAPIPNYISTVLGNHYTVLPGYA